MSNYNLLFFLAIAIALQFALKYHEQMQILCHLLFARLSHNNWSQQVRQARLDHGWSQQELAERVGVDVRTIQRWEAGTQSPHLSTQSLFYKALKGEIKAVNKLFAGRTEYLSDIRSFFSDRN